MKKTIRYLLVAVVIAGAGYLVVKEQGREEKAQKTEAAVVKETVACEPMQYALTRIFGAKAYQDLAQCMAKSVRYSRFESSDSRQLKPEEMVGQMLELSGGVKSWITDPEHEMVKKIREAHINAWSDSYIILGEDESGWAFSLDREGKIQTAVYITNYPGISGN